MVPTNSSLANDKVMIPVSPTAYNGIAPAGARGSASETPRTRTTWMLYLMPATSSSMAVVTDFGRSIAYPRPLSQVMFVSTPIALPTPNRTV